MFSNYIKPGVIVKSVCSVILANCPNYQVNGEVEDICNQTSPAGKSSHVHCSSDIRLHLKRGNITETSCHLPLLPWISSDSTGYWISALISRKCFSTTERRESCRKCFFLMLEKIILEQVKFLFKN